MTGLSATSLFSDSPLKVVMTHQHFSAVERQMLLLTPGIGPLVLDRLEEVGIASIGQLSHRGVEAVVDLVCQHVGSCAWGNRKRALVRALRRAVVETHPLAA